VKKSVEENRRSWSTEQDSRIDKIQRKPLPLPSSVERPASEDLQTPPKTYTQSPRRLIKSDGDIQGGNLTEGAQYVSVRSPNESSTTESSIIPRKPVGPRPISLSLRTADSGLIGRKPVGSSTAYRSTGQTPSAVLPDIQSSHILEGERIGSSSGNGGADAYLDVLPLSTLSIASDHHQFPPPPRLPTRPSYSSMEHETERDFITIIRRDPTSGSQWNIGSLSRPQRLLWSDRNLMKIEITTPGYQKFARQADCQAQKVEAFGQATEEARGSSSAGILSTANERYASTPKSSRPSSAQFIPTPFTRDIILSKQPSHRAKGAYQHHRSSSSESFSIPISPKTPAQLTFLSPWNGHCTFTTGMDGRSLKCRHRLPSSTSDPRDNSAVVAELRFNLPWSALRSKDGNTTSTSTSTSTSVPAGKRIPHPIPTLGSDAKHTLKKGLARLRQELRSPSSDPESSPSSLPHRHHHHHRRHRDANANKSEAETEASDQASASSSSSLASTSRLDLALGRERLGGGRTGKSAKLGKLVVRDEGLKMADLLVAAAMAVWWGVYDG
jgi:hypothetical protein